VKITISTYWKCQLIGWSIVSVIAYAANKTAIYTQLEKMRFGDKVEFVFGADKNIDLKDIKMPALILQPFIENSLWQWFGAQRK
jgi:LytS/YehU family sensor histidine kinase